MEKFSLDYNKLYKDLNQPKRYKYADVKDKVTKVGFDVVRFMDPKDGEIDTYWRIEKGEDGAEYIVATYDSSNFVTTATVSPKSKDCPWEVMASHVGDLHIFYKNYPVTKIALSKLGLKKEDAVSISQYLPNKLASDQNMVNKLMKEVSLSDRNTLFEKFPELK